MQQPKSAIEIYKLLEQSNCGECGEKTCLAFAAAVMKGQRALGDCSRLSREELERLGGPQGRAHAPERDPDEYLKSLKAQIAQMDLTEAAERTGGRFEGDRLIIQVMGKNFAVSANGDLFADIHMNHWVTIPVLSYIIHTPGRPVMDRWVSFRELREGRERYPLFQKRCEEPMKRVADSYSSLFDDMVHILGGSQVAEQFKADISVVLHPLPKVPVMMRYWLPDDGLESSLYVFFDETANENLDIGSVFMLATGLAQMFTKIGLTHGLAAAGPGR